MMIIIVLLLFRGAASFDTSCHTPEHQEGVCTSLLNCPSLHKLLENRPISQDSILYLRKSYCGVSGTKPKVCCTDAETNKVKEEEVNEESRISNLLPNRTICGLYSEDRIFGGDIAPLDAYGWNALLQYRTEANRTEFYCAGVLISEKYVLTAAHCIKGNNLPNGTKLVSVRLGEHNLETDPDCQSFADGLDCFPQVVDVPIEQTIVHDSYSPEDKNQYNDIALIRLQSKVTFNDFVNPVCLSSQLKVNSDSQLFTTGWGIDHNNIKYTKKNKFRGNVKNVSDCEEALKVRLDQGQLCVGKLPNIKPCAEDSGGLLLRFYLLNHDLNAYAVGIMSYGSCNTERSARVYTKIDQYTSWISSNLKP